MKRAGGRDGEERKVGREMRMERKREMGQTDRGQAKGRQTRKGS